MILITNEKYYDLLNTAVELLNKLTNNNIKIIKIQNNMIDVFIIDGDELKTNESSFVLAYLSAIKTLSDIDENDKRHIRGLLNLILIQLWKNQSI